jgi:peptidoglycan/xylan/chitin deacetylase (PgdA/CDA1 family)
MNHIDFHRALPSRVYSEVEQGRRVLEDIASVDVTMLRAPFGHFRWELKKTTPRNYLVHWDVAPRWAESSPDSLASWCVDRSTSGSIILLHDGLLGVDRHVSTAVGTASAAAVRRLVPELREKGLRFEILSRGLSSVN